MMKGELVVVDDVSVAFAEFIIDRYRTRVESRFAMALSGGDTARACYVELARRRAEVDWRTVDIWWGDERCVPLDDADSNHRLAHEALLDLVTFGSEHPMTCGDRGARDYEAALQGAPPLDVIHLGLGPDGHTASLFPGSSALSAPSDRLVVGNTDPTGLNPHRRLTFTYRGVARGRCVVVTVSGASKADALRRVRAGDPTAPATAIDAKEVVWLVDLAALDGSSPIGRSTGPR